MTPKSALLETLQLLTPQMTGKKQIPAFLYGTAWKKEATTELVYNALKNGFTGIDTACQPRHYREDLVGEGIKRAIKDNLCKRSDIFIQSKFTPIDGQDLKSIPYDPKLPLPDQVKQSIEVSLRHFTTDSDTTSQPYIDSLVLHSPLSTLPQTLQVWQTLESYVPHKIHSLGLSNTTLPILEALYSSATIKPSVVQNRFYASTQYDVPLRRFCQDRGIVYQSFWTLSGNPQLVRSRVVVELARKMEVSPQEALYVLVLGLDGIVVLNGTTSVDHMRGDWAAVEKAKGLMEREPDVWKTSMEAFRRMIGQV